MYYGAGRTADRACKSTVGVLYRADSVHVESRGLGRAVEFRFQIATKGLKVELLDTDHTWNNPAMIRTNKLRADHAWVWKSFLRGYHPIYMDPLDLAEPDGVMEYAKKNAYAIVLARPAMGHTRAYAERMDLAAMTPRDDLASTKYCLANPGREYLIYLPDGGKATVDLTAAQAAVAVEWFNPRTGDKRTGDAVNGGAMSSFQSPFEGDAVLYLHKP